MQYSRSEVNLYMHYELITTHKRLRSPHNHTTFTQHMPAQHRYVMEWNPAFFIAKAKEIDPVVEYYISQVVAKKQHPEQQYKIGEQTIAYAILDRIVHDAHRIEMKGDKEKTTKK